MALEVIWPKHKWDYLTVPDPDIPADPPSLPSTWVAAERSAAASFDISEANEAFASRQMMSTLPTAPARRRSHVVRDGVQERSLPVHNATERQSRALAVQAVLLGAHCLTPRVSELFGVSRRTVARDAKANQPQTSEIVAIAETLIAATAARGSTEAERDAATAWLEQGRRAASGSVNENAAEDVSPRDPPPMSSNEHEAETTFDTGTSNEAGRAGDDTLGTVFNDGQVAITELREAPMSEATAADRPHTSLSLDQIDALNRQQQRILHRTQLIDYVLAAEQRNGATLTLGDALAELLADITEAARTSTTILQHDARTPSQR